MMSRRRIHFPIMDTDFYSYDECKAFACFLLGYGQASGVAYLNTITLQEGDRYTMTDCLTLSAND